MKKTAKKPSKKTAMAPRPPIKPMPPKKDDKTEMARRKMAKGMKKGKC